MKINDLVKKITIYLQKDIEPYIEKKNEKYIRYFFILVGFCLIVLSDFRHIISVLIGLLMVSLGLNLFKDEPDNLTVRKIKDGKAIDVKEFDYFATKED